TCGHRLARIAANANGSFAVWSNVHSGFSMATYWMSGTMLDSGGHPQRPAEHTYETGAQTADIATDGRDFLLVAALNGSLIARVVDANGASGERRVLATNVPNDAAPVV